MILELFLIFTALTALQADGQQMQVGGAFQVPSFLSFVIGLAVFVAYLFTFGRSVWTAFTCQGLLQGLLSLFMYPVYLVWNFTSLVRATCK